MNLDRNLPEFAFAITVLNFLVFLLLLAVLGAGIKIVGVLVFISGLPVGPIAIAFSLASLVIVWRLQRRIITSPEIGVILRNLLLDIAIIVAPWILLGQNWLNFLLFAYGSDGN